MVAGGPTACQEMGKRRELPDTSPGRGDEEMRR